MLASGLPTVVGVFRSIEEATAWFAVDPAVE
jgi:hypothetical protein